MMGYLLGDSVSEGAEQHQKAAEGKGGERAAPDE
jgi:hypothetical protein